ncbi:hypothetical protein NDU88_000221 [Pleurodeles waltl]|uniref:Uncharacterized protein n=1 Tax=Pleurodeles waltl TaxID=8319 RepID=A0AAV7KQ41_PLEWA|nr:hypothetical protein NDU88_000221 [Pleurodeles waltl]
MSRQGVSVKSMVSSFETRKDPPPCGCSQSLGSNSPLPARRCGSRGSSPARAQVGTVGRPGSESPRRRAKKATFRSNMDKNLLSLLLIFHSGSSSSMVAIDNKIEQAMDLVKTHLMYAVREEVDVLREQIKDLMERNALLEQENTVLKSLASPEQLSEMQAKMQSLRLAMAAPPASSTTA